MTERTTGQVQRWLGRPSLQSESEQVDLVISSPDETLNEIASLLELIVGVDLETGADVRALNAVIGSATIESTTIESDNEKAVGATRLVVGAQPDQVFSDLGQFAIVEVASGSERNPPDRKPSQPNPPKRNPIATVGVHGFADRGPAPETSFSIQMIDDWGIDDVMGSALDLASRWGLPLGVIFDLAVLDPAYDSERTIPGGLDMATLLRAARTAGRRGDVAAGGFVKAGSDLNLAYVVMSFCAGLAGR